MKNKLKHQKHLRPLRLMIKEKFIFLILFFQHKFGFCFFPPQSMDHLITYLTTIKKKRNSICLLSSHSAIQNNNKRFKLFINYIGTLENTLPETQ